MKLNIQNLSPNRVIHGQVSQFAVDIFVSSMSVLVAVSPQNLFPFHYRVLDGIMAEATMSVELVLVDDGVQLVAPVSRTLATPFVTTMSYSYRSLPWRRSVNLCPAVWCFHESRGIIGLSIQPHQLFIFFFVAGLKVSRREYIDQPRNPTHDHLR